MSRFKYQIYLFQLENYNIRRYVRLMSHMLSTFMHKEHRQKLVWTVKAIALTVIAFVFVLLAASIAGCGANCGAVSGWIVLRLFLTSLAVFLFFFPFFLIAAQLVLAIPEFFVKWYIVSRATKKLRTFTKLKVVGIAGSYGKTTMKEMVAGVLSQNYNVVKTPETINTPLGIARLIERSIDATTEVFVVEMGEHVRGDVRDICRIVRPDVGIITGINEAHLERMGGMGKTIATIFELAESGPEHLVLNVDDPLVMQNYKGFGGQKFISFYSAEGKSPCEIFARKTEFHEDGSGQSFELEKGGKLVGAFTTPLLADYAIGTVIAALLVGASFRLEVPMIAQGISKVLPPKHRLEVVPTANGVLVIDDGFNGNPAGARAAMRVLNKFHGRRRIYVTPGLVEMGNVSDAVHEELGQELASSADVVVLVRTSATQHIVKGLAEAGFKKDNIIIFKSAKIAHEEIGNVVAPGDVVLFQNDWTDNYF